MKRYLEIQNIDTNEVIKRIDVTGFGERREDKLDDAININLNRDDFYTVFHNSDVALEIIK